MDVSIRISEEQNETPAKPATAENAVSGERTDRIRQDPRAAKKWPGKRE